jgi:hypothetical protein
MAPLHALLGWLTVGATVAVLVAALLAVSGAVDGRRWIDRSILAQIATAVAACVAGLTTAVMDRGPADPLHFLYAGVILGGLPGARYAVRSRSGPRFAGWIAVAALVVMGALLRSFMTGR